MHGVKFDYYWQISFAGGLIVSEQSRHRFEGFNPETPPLEFGPAALIELIPLWHEGKLLAARIPADAKPVCHFFPEMTGAVTYVTAGQSPRAFASPDLTRTGLTFRIGWRARGVRSYLKVDGCTGRVDLICDHDPAEALQLPAQGG